MAVPILRLNIDDNPRIIVKQDNMPVIVTGFTVNLIGSGATIVTGSGTDWTIYSPTGGTGGGTWGTITGTLSGQTDLWNELTGMTADIQSAQACCTGLTETFNTYTADTFNTLSGLTWAGIVLQAQVNGLENAFESHTGDTTIHFPFSDVTDAIASATSGITATSAWSGLTGYPTDNADLNAILTGMTADILANTQCCTGNTADIEYHYQQFTGFTDYVYTLIVPAITGNTQDISDLNDALTAHTSQTGSGSIHFTGHTFTASGIAVVSQTGDTINYYVPADAITGVTWGSITGTLSGQTDLQNALDLKLDNSVYQGDMLIIAGEIDDLITGLTAHTSDVTIHYVMSAITITESQISDLNAYTLTGTTAALQSAINTYTGTTAPASFLPITGLTGYWTSAQTVAYHTGNTPTVSLSGCSDVTITSPADYDILRYSGSTWINEAATDIFTNVADGELLARNGTAITGVTQSTFALSAHTHSQYLTGFTVTCDMVTGCTDGVYAPIVHTHEYSAITNTPDLSVYQPISGMSVYLTGVTWSIITGDISGNTALQNALNLKLDNSVYQGDMLIIAGEIDNISSGLTAHTGDTTIHFVQSAITITESQISDLKAYITGYTVTAGDVTGITATLYSPTVHTHTGVYAPFTTSIRSVTGATILTSADAGKIIECSGTFTLTLYSGATVGTTIDIVNVGTGTITLAVQGTLQSDSSKNKLATQYTGASVYARTSNTWLAVGKLTT